MQHGCYIIYAVAHTFLIIGPGGCKQGIANLCAIDTGFVVSRCRDSQARLNGACRQGQLSPKQRCRVWQIEVFILCWQRLTIGYPLCSPIGGGYWANFEMCGSAPYARFACSIYGLHLPPHAITRVKRLARVHGSQRICFPNGAVPQVRIAPCQFIQAAGCEHLVRGLCGAAHFGL